MREPGRFLVGELDSLESGFRAEPGHRVFHSRVCGRRLTSARAKFTCATCGCAEQRENQGTVIKFLVGPEKKCPAERGDTNVSVECSTIGMIESNFRTMKMVTVYDIDTKKTQTIPASELAPGMVQANVQGIGLVWIRADQTKHGALRHPPFSDELIELIKSQIQLPLEGVMPKTLAEWEDGFRRDQKPEQEIALWCHLASRFQNFAQAEELDVRQRHEAFNVLLACTLGPPEQILEIVRLSALTREQAQRAIDAFNQS